MPFECRFDDVRQRLRFTAVGDITSEDLREAIRFQIRESGWTYGSLYDATEATSFPSIEEMRALSDQLRSLTEAYGRRGPVAVAGRWPGREDAGRVADVIQTLPFTIRIFDGVQDAEEWLDSSPTWP